MKAYWGSGGIAPLILWPQHWIEASGQLHTPAALPPRERAPGAVKYEYRRKNSLRRNINRGRWDDKKGWKISHCCYYTLWNIFGCVEIHLNLKCRGRARFTEQHEDRNTLHWKRTSVLHPASSMSLTSFNDTFQVHTPEEERSNGRLEKLHEMELHNLHSSRGLEWLGYVAHVEVLRN
jgi:hypothetical protein